MTTLLLVRHGATRYTGQRRFSGCTGADPELSADGQRQAGALGAALRGVGPDPAGVDAVLSSPARRARQTAEVVAAALGLPVRVDDDLREIDFGSWEGLTAAAVERGWPDELSAWRAGTAGAPPGGEPVARVGERVRRARQRIVAAHPDRTVLVVSHLYPVRLSVLDALGAPYASAQRMALEPTAVCELRAGGGLLVRYNDAAHLRRAASG